MANSKSNIYPIQLQGAELNLNKYDAEIKQYSGFNKNNSPFVGGCLSNIYTKNEVVEGSNGNNIYIDSNENVYKVLTDGFYQNGQKLITYYPNQGTKFYKKTKLFENRNAVLAVSSKIYIDIQGDSYYAHWGSGFSERLGIIETDRKSHLNIEYKNGIIVFSYKRYHTNGYTFVYLYNIIVPNENNSYHLRTAPSNEKGNSLSSATTIRIDGNLMKQNNSQSFPQGVYIKTDEAVPEVWIAWNEDNGLLGILSGETTKLGLITYVLNGYITRRHPCTNFVNNLANCNVFSTYINSYYMTNDGVFHFVHLPYYNSISSKTYPGNEYNVPSIASGSHLLVSNNIRLKFLSSSSNPPYTTFEVVESVSTLELLSDLSGKQLINKNAVAYYNETEDLSLNFFSNYGVSFTSILVDSSNVNNEVVLPVVGKYLSMTVLNNSYKDIYASCLFYGNFKILINNGLVSNVSIYQKIYSPFNNSLHGAIIEDWNIINNFVIPSSGDKIIYGIDGVFYKVEESEPSLSLKNNQLVINCNNELNCYDIERQEVLHFGSDWNCSFIGWNQTIKINMFNTAFWLSAAINEYNLKDNPSIILNARNVLLSDLSNYLKFCMNVSEYFNKCTVNIYCDQFNTAPIYKDSASTGVTHKDYLIGLHFPNNTDGNVQYNPNIFMNFFDSFGTDVFIQDGKSTYQLMKSDSRNIMAYFLGTLVEGLSEVFIIQGQYFGIIGDKLFSISFANGVVSNVSFVVSLKGLQFCGNTPYQAIFFSDTNRCLYSFTGANVLNAMQLVDKIKEIKSYKYNPATQSIFLSTNLGIISTGIFGTYEINMTDIEQIFLLNKGIVLTDSLGNCKYIRYYKEDVESDYIKQNIRLETCFYGMNDQTVTINDCLYFRLFSEEHEAGELKVSATTLSLEGRKTEETTFKIKSSDWDKLTHTIYLRYQPKEQRGLGVSFSIDSPFKIAAMSVGSQADSILVDKVSKGAINAPQQTSNNTEW